MKVHPLVALQKDYCIGEAAFYFEDPELGHYHAALGSLSFEVGQGREAFFQFQSSIGQEAPENFYPVFLGFDQTRVDALPSFQAFRPKKRYLGSSHLQGLLKRPLLPKVVKKELLEPLGGYKRAVEAALVQIKKAEVKKLVLARGITLLAEQAWDPWELAIALKQAYPMCQLLVWINPTGESFVSASPERLLRVKGKEVWTEALAGTAPRGNTVEEEARFESTLLNSDKDEHEQALVVSQIVHILQQAGLQVFSGERQLRKLPLLQHVLTLIRAEGKVNLAQLIQALHPTNAVCGEPKDKALALIRKLEGFERGFYASSLGWVNGLSEGQFAVGIRGIELNGKIARVMCGAGIVRHSIPEKEYAETNLKLQGLLRSLGA